MDFEALITQIGELERANREEERKLIEEKQKHDATKREFEKISTELKGQKEKEVLLLEKVTAILTEKETEAKTVRQLKETIKSLKKENEVLKEHSANEIKLTKEKREEFIRGLMMANEQLRKIREHQGTYGIGKEDAMVVQEVTHVVDPALVAERDKALRQVELSERKLQDLDTNAKHLEATIHQLRTTLVAREEEIQALREERARALASIAPVAPQQQVPNASDANAELEALKKEVKEKEAELALVFKELEKLDHYCKTLEENIAGFQELFTQIQTSAQELKCQGCGAAVPFSIS